MGACFGGVAEEGEKGREGSVGSGIGGAEIVAVEPRSEQRTERRGSDRDVVEDYGFLGRGHVNGLDFVILVEWF